MNLMIWITWLVVILFFKAENAYYVCLKILPMKLVGASVLLIVAFCSSSEVLRRQDQFLLKDVDAKINEEIHYYKANPIKAKKRFSAVLSRLGSRRSLNRVRKATWKQINSKSKVKDAIARRFIKMFKKRQTTQGLPFESDLFSRLNSTMIKVCPSL